MRTKGRVTTKAEMSCCLLRTFAVVSLGAAVLGSTDGSNTPCTSKKGLEDKKVSTLFQYCEKMCNEKCGEGKCISMPLGSGNNGLNREQFEQACPLQNNANVTVDFIEEGTREVPCQNFTHRDQLAELREIIYETLGKKKEGNYFDDIRIAQARAADELKKVEEKAESVFKKLSEKGASLTRCQFTDEFIRLKKKLTDRITNLQSTTAITRAYEGIAENAKTARLEDKVSRLLLEIAALLDERCVAQFYTQHREEVCVVTPDDEAKGLYVGCCCFNSSFHFRAESTGCTCPVKYKSSNTDVLQARFEEQSLNISDDDMELTHKETDSCDTASYANFNKSLEKSDDCEWKKSSNGCDWSCGEKQDKSGKCFPPNQGSILPPAPEHIKAKATVCADQGASGYHTLDPDEILGKCAAVCDVKEAKFLGAVMPVPVGGGNQGLNWNFTQQEFCAASSTSKSCSDKNWAKELLTSIHNSADYGDGSAELKQNAFLDLQSIGPELLAQHQAYVKDAQEELRTFLEGGATSLKRSEITERLVTIRAQLGDKLSKMESMQKAQEALMTIAGANKSLAAAINASVKGVMTFVENNCTAQLTVPKPRAEGYSNPSPVCGVNADDIEAGKLISCCCFGTAYSLAAPLGDECPVEVGVEYCMPSTIWYKTKWFRALIGMLGAVCLLALFRFGFCGLLIALCLKPCHARRASRYASQMEQVRKEVAHSPTSPKRIV